MIDKKVQDDEIGLIWYKSSTKAKSINITVKPFTPVKVSIPHAISLVQAESTVEQNIDWIKREVAKMDQVEQEFTIFRPHFTYKFQDVTVDFRKADVSEITVIQETDNYLLVHSPKIAVFTESQQSHIIENIITPKMKEWCKSNVAKRAKELAKIHNITIPRVSIRKSKTRWGSLGKKDTLNLSLYTATLPSDLIDYVILHELAHTKYRDHSKLYWGYLKSLASNYDSESKKLKSFKIGII